MGAFPGGSVIKNSPANTGGMGSIPGPGRSHMQWSNQVYASQQLSLCSRARESQLLFSATREATVMRNLITTTREQPLLTTPKGEPEQWRPAQPKINK